MPRNENTTDAIPVVSALQQAGYQLHHLILRDYAQLTKKELPASARPHSGVGLIVCPSLQRVCQNYPVLPVGLWGGAWFVFSCLPREVTACPLPCL